MDVKVFGDGITRVGVRPITPNIYWITHCLGDQASDYYADYFASLPDASSYTYHKNVDYYFSSFLFVGEKTLLIDTGAPTQEESTIQAIQYALNGKPLDYIWISHIEIPHAGNSAAIKRLYPQAKLVTSKGGDHYYMLHNLDEAMQVEPGDVLDLGQLKIEMVEAMFVDHGFSQWAYEQDSGMYITIDWGHNLHDAGRGQNFMFLDEMYDQSDYTDEQFVQDLRVNFWYQFPWLAFTDPVEISGAVEQMFSEREVKILASSHGSIIRKDTNRFVPLFQEGMRQAAGMPYGFFD